MSEPSLTQVVLQALVAIINAADVALRAGGVTVLVVLLIVWAALRRKRGGRGW